MKGCDIPLIRTRFHALSNEDGGYRSRFLFCLVPSISLVSCPGIKHCFFFDDDDDIDDDDDLAIDDNIQFTVPSKTSIAVYQNISLINVFCTVIIYYRN